MWFCCRLWRSFGACTGARRSRRLNVRQKRGHRNIRARLGIRVVTEFRQELLDQMEARRGKWTYGEELCESAEQQSRTPGEDCVAAERLERGGPDGVRETRSKSKSHCNYGNRV